MKIKKLFAVFSGFCVGLINGLLGAGAGMLVVPLIKKQELSQKEAHASTIAVILPLTIVSACVYLFNGYVTLEQALPYIPTGFIGALAGTCLFHKLNNKVLKNIFALFMIWAGIRMILK